MSGFIKVVGLGPGNGALITPQVQAALDLATDIVGYIPYVARVTRVMVWCCTPRTIGSSLTVLITRWKWPERAKKW